jgi:hypothetical protein
VHLKPTPLEFAPVQFGTIDIDKALAGAAAAAQDSPGAVNTTTTTTSIGNSSSSSSNDISSISGAAGLPDVGYLKLLSFSATAPQEVAQALVDMQFEAAEEHGGHGLAGLIVDLRDNPGGLGGGFGWEIRPGWDGVNMSCLAMHMCCVVLAISAMQDVLAHQPFAAAIFHQRGHVSCQH